MSVTDVTWQVAVGAGCEVAERPVWDVDTGTLLWVDLTGGQVHRSAPGSAAAGQWSDHATKVGVTVGAVALRRDGGLVAAADSAFLFLGPGGAWDADRVPVPMPDGSRFNDGVCDPAGRFLAGTTSSSTTTPDGALWSLGSSGPPSILLEGIVESNGLGWSPDGTLMYYVDSGEPVVRRYDYDPVSGRVGKRQPDLAVIADGDGVPDGLVVDADGAVWVALWEGGAVRRYSPDGEPLATMRVPVDRPTCPGFAGPGLDLLVVTTAWEGLDPGERARQPWAGHLLVADVTVAGRPAARYGGRA